ERCDHRLVAGAEATNDHKRPERRPTWRAITRTAVSAANMEAGTSSDHEASTAAKMSSARDTRAVSTLNDENGFSRRDDRLSSPRRTRCDDARALRSVRTKIIPPQKTPKTIANGMSRLANRKYAMTVVPTPAATELVSAAAMGCLAASSHVWNGLID